jgi:hypothetical protein
MPRSRHQRAVELRDIALTIVQQRGKEQPVRGRSPALVYREGKGRRSIRIAYRIEPKRGMRQTLDITLRAGLLSIEWSDDGRVEVLSYKPGPWERQIADMASRRQSAKATAADEPI